MVTPSGSDWSIPSQCTPPSLVSATLVKMVFLTMVAMALGLVLAEVPGATPKNPFSGLMARRLPRDNNKEDENLTLFQYDYGGNRTFWDCFFPHLRHQTSSRQCHLPHTQPSNLEVWGRAWPGLSFHRHWGRLLPCTSSPQQGWRFLRSEQRKPTWFGKFSWQLHMMSY